MLHSSKHPAPPRRRRSGWAGAVVGMAMLTAAGCGSQGAAPAHSSRPRPAPRTTLTPAPTPAPTAAAPTWLAVDRTTKTATLTLIAAYNQAAGGFNFDGYANGAMTVSVPQGWKVVVHFENRGTLPHSAAIVSSPTAKTPAFAGAGLPAGELVAGLGQGQSATFSFTPDKVGQYRIVCLVPGHESLGMWDRFIVTAGGSPAVKTG